MEVSHDLTNWMRVAPRCSGGGCKLPAAATFKRCGGERVGKRQVWVTELNESESWTSVKTGVSVLRQDKVSGGLITG